MTINLPTNCIVYIDVQSSDVTVLFEFLKVTLLQMGITGGK